MRNKWILCWTMALGGMFALSSCSENENTSGTVTEADIPAGILSAFGNRYPDASNVAWSIKDGYAVADFHSISARSANPERNHTAWFSMNDGQWDMTRRSVPFDMLPDSVLAAFRSTEYVRSPWVTDPEADVLLRDMVETLYVIEVEKRENNVETEADLYYAGDGTLVKLVFDAEKENDYWGYLPNEMTGNINQWIDANYPGARIVDFDDEDGGYEVEIIWQGHKYDIVFSRAQEWLYTKVEYGRHGLALVEDAVLATLRASEYYTTDAAVDDIEKYITAASGTFYKFELETFYDDDIDVYIMLDGTLLDNRPSLGNEQGGVPVDSDIEQFIKDRYPGAVITDKDYDKGYIEVEIRHDGVEKDVIFNGRHEWLRTEWEISLRQLPQNIIDALEKKGYDRQRMDDDVEVWETADGLRYIVEVEIASFEVRVTVGSDGQILDVVSERD